jgi:predicted transcriptional regulator
MPAPPALDRPDLYVVARLLEKLWREGEPMLKTRLQVAANVNYDIFRRYLSWMSERDLVEVSNCEDGHERVGITTNGTEAYRKLVQLISDLFHEG